MRVAIAGGGLGGLAAALFLLRAGVRDVVVFEQQSQLGEIGAGIQVAPNAVRLLQRLGVGPALTDVAVPFEVAWEFRRWEDGGCCSRKRSARRARRASGRRTWRLHRADLLSVLADAVPDGVVVLGRHVSGVDGDRFVFADGSVSESFDVLVGADGIHSVVRGARSPGRARRCSPGSAAYRALVPAAAAPEPARRPVCSIWLGPEPPLRPLSRERRLAGQPRHRRNGGRLARGVLDRAGRGRPLLDEFAGWMRRCSN